MTAKTPEVKTTALRRTLGLIRPHVRSHSPILAGGALALMLEVVFRVLEPWPVKFVVDAVTRSLGADLADSGPQASFRLLLACALATIALVGFRAIFNYLATIAFALGGSRIATELRQRVFHHVNTLSTQYHSTSRSGDLVQRLVGDVGRLQEVAVTAGMPLLVNVFTLLAMSGVMFWLDPMLALIVVVAAILFLLMSRTSTPKITQASRKTRKAEGDLANIAQETVGGMRVVQAYGLESALEEKFSGRNAKSLKDGVQAKRLSAALERGTDVLVGCATATVLMLGGYRVMEGAMTPGDLVIFLTYLKTAMKPLRDLAKYTGRIARAAASGERVADVLDQEPDITSPADPVDLGRIRGEVRLERVSAGYGDNPPVLQGLDLHIPQGQRVAVVGPSGAGKSTLTGLVTRMMDVRGGGVRIDGVDVRRLDVHDLRSQIAVVLQESVLFTGTIADNIRYGNLEATNAQVVRAAELARADEFIRRMPEGYDTAVGERGSTLSGGQRQRIAIARALLRDASIVILDEATAGLDAENAGAVREAIDRLTRGRTTLVVTHDEQTARECDRIVWIEGGGVRFDGPSDSVLPEGAAFTGSSEPHGQRQTQPPPTAPTAPTAPTEPVLSGTAGR
ncbi:ABC transporter ATP-binding protein [Ornithinimicrobium faecis]|uniref:ABC transporter ATP-binding protein n=1 Tax=Ornithinimicrobium faecis TaxID=2934158 RepID=UPI002117E8D1|nr:ABC transporter ATP-binding protein [Ornithinimicrobium sp. HY1745]